MVLTGIKTPLTTAMIRTVGQLNFQDLFHNSTDLTKKVSCHLVYK